MSFNWEEYYNLAKELLGNKVKCDNEAKHRTSISRAYYACFCIARNKMIQKGGTVPKNGPVHTIVKDFFLNHSNKQYTKIGMALDRLKDDRKKSDYEDFVPKIELLSAKSLLEAKESLDLLKQI